MHMRIAADLNTTTRHPSLTSHTAVEIRWDDEKLILRYALLWCQQQMRTHPDLISDRHGVGIVAGADLVFESIQDGLDIEDRARGICRESHFQFDRIADSLHRQRAVGDDLVTRLAELAGYKVGLGKLGYVEEFLVGKQHITLRIAGVGAGQIHHDVEFRIFELGRVVTDCRLEAIEATLELFALEGANEAQPASVLDRVVG